MNVVRMPVSGPGPLAMNLTYPVTCPHWLFIDISLAPLIRFPHADDADLPPACDSSDHSETGGADPTAIAVAYAHWPRGGRD